MIWNLEDDQEWCTAAELSRHFRVSASTIYKWRALDNLTTVRINGRDYSPIREAAAIDRAKRDETRGAPRQLDTTAA